MQINKKSKFKKCNIITLAFDTKGYLFYSRLKDSEINKFFRLKLKLKQNDFSPETVFCSSLWIFSVNTLSLENHKLMFDFVGVFYDISFRY